METRAIGIEIADSGTRFTATLTADPSACRWHARLPAPPAPEEALAALHALIARALAESATAEGVATADMATADSAAERVAIGVALWDVAAVRGGVVRGLRHAPDWEDFPLAARLTERWGGPVHLELAWNAAALAEARLGAARDARLALYVLLGRSIWSTLLLEGQIVRGEVDGGMLAHFRVRPDGPRCSCGLLGHLEPLASAQALVRNLIGRAAATDASTAAMLAEAGGRAEAMSAAQVVALAARGEPAAAGVLDDALDGLAIALANLSAVLHPDVIVVGGPLADVGAAFFDPLRARLEMLCRPFAAPPPLAPGALEPAAALLGAWLLAAETVSGASGGRLGQP